LTEETSTAGSTISPPVQDANGLAIAGLVCGLVGTVFFNVILGPLAIIFGGIGWARARRGAKHKGMAIAAVILGVIDLVVFAALLSIAARHGGFAYFHVG
jgi:hypothetical protein